VGGMSDGRIPWPRAQSSGRPLILCGDLIKAVQCESSYAIMYHFGVGSSVVTRWRKALGVPPINEGSWSLKRREFLSRDRLHRCSGGTPGRTFDGRRGDHAASVGYPTARDGVDTAT